MSKQRVLVVDDEPSVLLTYKMILEQEGYQVTSAATSKEAYVALNDEPEFELVLCDFSLEQQHTGFEVIEAVKKLNSETPCVLLTGYANMETAQEAKRRGIHVLFKPIEIEEFLQTTSTLLRRADGPKVESGN
jgi:DNA-binding NtrC family response regulator